MQFTTDDFSKYEYIKNEYPCVQFKQVDYSISYLDEIIDDFILSYNSKYEIFYSAYVDVKNNCAIINVDDNTFESRSMEKSGAPVEYKIGSPQYTYASKKTIYGGKLLVNKKSNSIVDLFNHITFSAGIGATTLKGKSALVSCGHGMKEGDKIFYDDTHIGNVEYVSYSDYALGDYCIITMTENGSASNFAMGSSTGSSSIFYNHGVHKPIVGEIVFKYTENSGYASYEIKSLNETVNTFDERNDITAIINGQVLAEYISDNGGITEHGDSGGGIFFFGEDYEYYFCGVISTYDEPINQLSFTPYSSIQMKCSIMYG